MLLFQSWIVQGQNTSHCIPIEESRVLHEIAGKYFGVREALLVQNDRVVFLENKIERENKEYQSQISILKANLLDQRMISDDYQKHSQSLSDEVFHLQKANKRQKGRNLALKIIIVGLSGVILFQSIP